MDEKYQNVLSEVDEILKNTDEELINKIPSSVKQFVKENKSKSHVTQIDSTKLLEEQNILPETKAILALFYRSYWATEQEKEEFAKQDAIELEKQEQIKMENYPSNIFKEINEKRRLNKETSQNTLSKETENQVTDITVILEEKWYQKIWKKLCSLFKKK